MIIGQNMPEGLRMSEIGSDNKRDNEREGERELNNKKRSLSYYILLSLVVRMREHAHYMPFH